MKLLTEVSDINELNRLRLLFEANEVPIFVGNADAARNFSFLHPSGKYAINVVFDEQYEDAKKLLEDEDHIVKIQVDMDAYNKYMQESSSAIATQMLKKTLFIAATFILAVIGFVWLLVA